ncbi:hypothetical protein AEA09_09110 [Lysinibacillus contaminans]|uniref:Uncharacterized protein n=1 Tax=Lysinibacillus contaminans TaxID=1293441 RepID=A0ABR5K2W1_9BACI|nr:hypothetical protein [Lysinibacillus contaminans]KOS68684.1 hypothetical protein AEA09_09110 [Lysinibacillus contaminans]
MNNVKKELLKVAGDMATSKERVKERIQGQRNLKPKKPIHFIVMSAVVTLCIVGFITIQLLDGGTKQSAQLFNHTQLEYFEDLERIMWATQDPPKEFVYGRYEQQLASYYFAQSLGFDSTMKEQEAEKEKRYNELQNLQEDPKFKEIFGNRGLDSYFEKYVEPLLPMYVAEKKLNGWYQEKYPTFPESMVHDIAEQDAIRYFNTHFTEEAKSFQEELGLKYYSNIPNGSTYVGTVVELDSNAFFFVEGAIPEDLERLSKAKIIEKYKNATWYPIEDGALVKKGDYVEVSSSSSMSEDTSKVERYGLQQSMAVIDPTVTTKLKLQNPDEVAVFLQQVNWQQGETSIIRPPDYSFMLDGVRVDVLVTHAKTLRLHVLEYGDVKLSEKSSEQLKGLLGI